MKKKIACLIVFLLVLGSCAGTKDTVDSFSLSESEGKCLRDYQTLLCELSTYSPTAESLHVFYLKNRHLAKLQRPNLSLSSPDTLRGSKEFYIAAADKNFDRSDFKHYLGASYQPQLKAILLLNNNYPPLLQALGFCHELIRAELYYSVQPDSVNVPFEVQLEMLAQFGLSNIINEYTHGNWMLAVTGALEARKIKLWRDGNHTYDEFFPLDDQLLAALFPRLSLSDRELLKPTFILDLNTRRIAADSENIDYALFNVRRFFKYYYRDKVPGKNE